MPYQLTPELESLLDDRLATGFYESPEEALRQALAVLAELDSDVPGLPVVRSREELVSSLAEARRDLDAGRGLALTTDELRDHFGQLIKGLEEAERRSDSAT